jgi:hypothetical protein
VDPAAARPRRSSERDTVSDDTPNGAIHDSEAVRVHRGPLLP